MSSSAVRRTDSPQLVTVILPVRNEARHLPTQLEALRAQTYRGNFEVVVVDNGSDDGSADVAREWGNRICLRVVDAPLVGLNRARNAGLDAAHGELVAYCDGDDRVTPGWLEALVNAAAIADLVGGIVDPGPLQGRVEPLRRADRLSRKHDFLPAVSGGNCAVWADAARSLRWDESYRFGSSDIEFSWRAGMDGLRVECAPDAVVDVRLPATTRELAAKYYAYGRSDPQLFVDFHAAGMARSRLKPAARQWLWLVAHAVDLARTEEHRRRWVRVAARRVGRLHGSIERRVWFP